ncbi:hypothetical protein NDU88_004804 [Pleurodeles waltl]|uniref:Uncharacterized protein n=1 Tax=Pleurodeles waltl TaxID=8319 RepID=A0AAV7SJZ5_PLEWA|nr:hypothetical protein NDU88_004804 [Pleurodeles waltl]
MKRKHLEDELEPLIKKKREFNDSLQGYRIPLKRQVAVEDTPGPEELEQPATADLQEELEEEFFNLEEESKKASFTKDMQQITGKNSIQTHGAKGEEEEFGAHEEDEEAVPSGITLM